MRATIDHVAFAWEDLDEISDVFHEHGLTSDYGGVHRDGTTEMATLGFRDGSYVELIGPTESETRPQRWPDEIRHSASPCGWAVEVDDLRRELTRLIERGVRVNGPQSGSRERPDGTVAEWETGIYGTEETVQQFPFFISDLTPRDYRVRPSESVVDTCLTGFRRS